VLQETLESAGIPFVGSDSVTSALAMDKCATKRVLRDVNIPTAHWEELVPGKACPLEPPVVIKPTAEGSSVGIRMCPTTEDVDSARRELEERYSSIMAEAFIDGREVTIGIVEGELLPLIEIRSANTFYDYDAKYKNPDTEYLFDPDLDPGVAEAGCSLLGVSFSRLASGSPISRSNAPENSTAHRPDSRSKIPLSGSPRPPASLQGSKSWSSMNSEPNRPTNIRSFVHMRSWRRVAGSTTSSSCIVKPTARSVLKAASCDRLPW
jgi:hypothetical protein